jgi:hypothetical protein
MESNVPRLDGPTTYVSQSLGGEERVTVTVRDKVRVRVKVTSRKD